MSFQVSRKERLCNQTITSLLALGWRKSDQGPGAALAALVEELQPELLHGRSADRRSSTKSPRRDDLQSVQAWDLSVSRCKELLDKALAKGCLAGGDVKQPALETMRELFELWECTCSSMFLTNPGSMAPSGLRKRMSDVCQLFDLTARRMASVTHAERKAQARGGDIDLEAVLDFRPAWQKMGVLSDEGLEASRWIAPLLYNVAQHLWRLRMKLEDHLGEAFHSSSDTQNSLFTVAEDEEDIEAPPHAASAPAEALLENGDRAGSRGVSDLDLLRQWKQVQESCERMLIAILCWLLSQLRSHRSASAATLLLQLGCLMLLLLLHYAVGGLLDLHNDDSPDLFKLCTQLCTSLMEVSPHASRRGLGFGKKLTKSTTMGRRGEGRLPQEGPLSAPPPSDAYSSAPSVSSIVHRSADEREMAAMYAGFPLLSPITAGLPAVAGNAPPSIANALQYPSHHGMPALEPRVPLRMTSDAVLHPASAHPLRRAPQSLPGEAIASQARLPLPAGVAPAATGKLEHQLSELPAWKPVPAPRLFPVPTGTHALPGVRAEGEPRQPGYDDALGPPPPGSLTAPQMRAGRGGEDGGLPYPAPEVSDSDSLWKTQRSMAPVMRQSPPPPPPPELRVPGLGRGSGPAGGEKPGIAEALGPPPAGLFPAAAGEQAGAGGAAAYPKLGPSDIRPWQARFLLASTAPPKRTSTSDAQLPAAGPRPPAAPGYPPRKSFKGVAGMIRNVMRAREAMAQREGQTRSPHYDGTASGRARRGLSALIEEDAAGAASLPAGAAEAAPAADDSGRAAGPSAEGSSAEVAAGPAPEPGEEAGLAEQAETAEEAGLAEQAETAEEAAPGEAARAAALLQLRRNRGGRMLLEANDGSSEAPVNVVTATSHPEELSFRPSREALLRVQDEQDEQKKLQQSASLHDGVSLGWTRGPNRRQRMKAAGDGAAVAKDKAKRRGLISRLSQAVPRAWGSRKSLASVPSDVSSPGRSSAPSSAQGNEVAADWQLEWKLAPRFGRRAEHGDDAGEGAGAAGPDAAAASWFHHRLAQDLMSTMDHHRVDSILQEVEVWADEAAKAPAPAPSAADDSNGRRASATPQEAAASPPGASADAVAQWGASHGSFNPLQESPSTLDPFGYAASGQLPQAGSHLAASSRLSGAGEAHSPTASIDPFGGAPSQLLPEISNPMTQWKRAAEDAGAAMAGRVSAGFSSALSSYGLDAFGTASSAIAPDKAATGPVLDKLKGMDTAHVLAGEQVADGFRHNGDHRDDDDDDDDDGEDDVDDDSSRSSISHSSTRRAKSALVQRHALLPLHSLNFSDDINSLVASDADEEPECSSAMDASVLDVACDGEGEDSASWEWKHVLRDQEMHIAYHEVTTCYDAEKLLEWLLARFMVIPHCHVRLVAELGSGSFATVFRGEWRKRVWENQLEVAVKVLHQDIDNMDPDQELKGFMREVDCQGVLDHNNVVKLIGIVVPWEHTVEASRSNSEEAGDQDTDVAMEDNEHGIDLGLSNAVPLGRLCIVMEYCQLGSLMYLIRQARDVQDTYRNEVKARGLAVMKRVHDKLMEDPSIYEQQPGARLFFDWGLRLRLLGHSARGLAYMHERNFLHRDLTSYNILVHSHPFSGVKGPPQWTAKLADFNLCRYATSGANMLTANSLAPHSLAWTAPESIAQREINSSSDVFSLGIVLWELMTLKLPPGGGSNQYRVIFAANHNNAQVLSFPSYDELLPAVPSGWDHEAVVKLAVRCMSPEMEKRPTAVEVADAIDSLLASLNSG